MAKIPIACTLTDAQAASQVSEWQALHGAVTERVEIEGGLMLTFPGELHDTVVDLAAREADCCGFLVLAVDSVGGHTRLRVTSDQREARPVIEMLAGVGSVGGS